MHSNFQTLRISFLLCALLIPLGPVAPAALATDLIEVGIYSPEVDAEIAGEFLLVIATITSTYEIINVTAVIGSDSWDLDFDSCAIDRGFCQPGWVAETSLAELGLAPGVHLLEIEAENAFTTTGSATRNFTYAPPPTLTVTYPIDDAVATPLLDVLASCEDVIPAPCSSLTVSVSGEAPLIEATTSIDEAIDLTGYDGEQVTLVFSALGSTGTPVSTTRVVYVETNVRLEEVERLPGTLYAADATSAVFIESDKTLTLRDRETEADTPIFTLEDKGDLSKAFTAGDAILFSVHSSTLGTYCTGYYGCVFEYYDEELIDLGGANSSLSLEVEGDWATWNRSADLFLRDLQLGTNELVATNAGNGNNSVASNGDLVFWTTGHAIHRFRSDEITPLAEDGINVYPSTDGIHVVYKKKVSTLDYELWLQPEDEEAADILLAEASQGGGQYLTRNGWVAFTREGVSSARQVWLRSPEGTLTQKTFFAAGAQLASLGSQGEITFTTSGRRCYIPAEGSADPVCFDIGSSNGSSFYIGNELHVALGNSLFRIFVPEPSTRLHYLVAFATTALLLGRKRLCKDTPVHR